MPKQEPGESAEPDASFVERLVQGLERALDAMNAQKLIEFEDANKPELIIELASAAAEATSERDLIKRVVRTLVHSDHVEEVYAGDLKLADALRAALPDHS